VGSPELAKVRVAGSNPVVRSKKVLVSALIEGALFRVVGRRATYVP
jgi:hypothetical protein